MGIKNPEPAKKKSDHAGVKFPPPLVFIGGMLAGLVYDSPWIAGQLADIVPSIVGGLMTIIGIALMRHTVKSMKRAKTNIEPWRKTTTILTTGIYAHSRNPMYLGMAFIHGGIAIGGGSIAALITLLISIIIIQVLVIAKEERYLERQFGSEYLDYKKRTRRWI